MHIYIEIACTHVDSMYTYIDSMYMPGDHDGLPHEFECAKPVVQNWKHNHFLGICISAIKLTYIPKVYRVLFCLYVKHIVKYICLDWRITQVRDMANTQFPSCQSTIGKLQNMIPVKV